MSKKTIVFLILLIVLPIIVYFLWPTNESRIKKLIKEGVNAVEEKKLDELMSKVSFKYQDDYGLSYVLIRRLFQEQFNRFSDIEIDYENLKIKVNDKNATAWFDMRVIATSGQDRGYFMGDIKEPAHLTVELEKGPMGKWLVTKVSGWRGIY